MREFKWKKQDNNHRDLISMPNICNLLMWKTHHLSTSFIAYRDSMFDKHVSQKFAFNHFTFIIVSWKVNTELTKMQKSHKNLDKKIKGWILSTSFVLLRSNMINIYSFRYHRMGTTGSYRPFPYSLAYCHTTSFKQEQPPLERVLSCHAQSSSYAIFFNFSTLDLQCNFLIKNREEICAARGRYGQSTATTAKPIYKGQPHTGSKLLFKYETLQTIQNLVKD